MLTRAATTNPASESTDSSTVHDLRVSRSEMPKYFETIQNPPSLTCEAKIEPAEIAMMTSATCACEGSLCASSGAVWGYYPSADVAVAGDTSRYRRGDVATPSAEIHFCPTCGSTTHFTMTEHVE